ncbi:MAG: autotransporter-associated beta strand repeat-containing protein [Planctomycetota bacterium]|nr:autotransporter-associated beta strand repeat-containing protein [Planctomycetota bacterium]
MFNGNTYDFVSEVNVLPNTISGTARFGITKVGTGSQTFTGIGQHTGVTTISEGTLVAGSSTALGFGGWHALNTQGGTVVNGTGASVASTLKLTNGLSVDEVITLNGATMGANLLIDSGSATLNNGVADIVLTNAGSGGTTAGANINATVAGTGTGASGNGWKAGATIQKVGVTNAGTGYTSAPTVTLSSTAGTHPVNSAATAVISAVTLTTNNNNIGGDGDLMIKSRIGGAGGFSKLGDGTVTLSGTNNYAGPTTIDDGLLKLLAVDADEAGSITSNVTVNAAGTLGGNGVVVGSVSGGGTVSPGNSIGTLGVAGTYNVTGTHDFEIAKISGVESNDLLNQITDITYDGTLKVTLDGTSDPLATYAIGDSWDLFDFTTRIGTSVFANDALFGTEGDGVNLPMLDPGMAWTFDYDTGVLAIEVPEPSTYLLLSIGALGMLVARRRLRK